MASSAGIRIGALSRQSGVNIETIRYYERIGVLPKAPRSSGGYRLYRHGDVARLAFVRRARGLGFSLDDVRELLTLADGKSRSCQRVYNMAGGRLADVRARLVDLRRLEGVLVDMVATCAEGTLPVCPILDALTHAA